MPLLTRDQVLYAKLRTKEVEVPEWGGSIIIQELSVEQQELIEKPRSNADAGLKIFLEGVKQPKFEPGDYDALKAQGTAAMTRVLNEILELSGMSKDADKKIPNG